MKPNAPAGHPVYVYLLTQFGRPPDVMLIKPFPGGFAGFAMCDFPGRDEFVINGRDFGPAANQP